MQLMTRHQAKLIAEELYKLIRKDCVIATQEIAKQDNEEFLTVKEAAAYMKCTESNIYKKKDIIGAYTKIGNQLRFPKSQLKAIIESGRLSGAI